MSDEVGRWCASGLIKCIEPIDKDAVRVTLAAEENLGSHFSRELIPLGSGIREYHQFGQEYIVKATGETEVDAAGREVLDTLITIASKTALFTCDR